MTVQLGCMLRPYNNVSLERALEGIAGAGFKYTAYLPNSYFDGDTTDAQLQELRATVESFGVQAVTVWGGDITRQSPEQIVRFVEQCGVLGLSYIIVSSPYDRGEEARGEEQTGDDFMRAMEVALPVLEQVEVRMDVKPHLGPFGTGPGMAALARRVNHPLFGVSYDPGNIRYYEGLDPKEDLPPVAAHVRSLCVKDHAGEQRESNFPNPGDGDVDWPDVFQQLARVNFSGYALIEVLQGDTPEAVDAAARQTHDRLLAWLTPAR